MGEFDAIARHFAPLARSPGAFGLTDDAAIVAMPEGRRIVVTTDAIVAGRHFPADERPDIVARRLQRVNLSDLAAMGAAPLAYFIALAAPDEADDDWFAAFANGLRLDQEEFGWGLMGGDTVATSGAPTFALTAIGHVEPAGLLLRSGARIGDILCVSGDIGDAALGLLAHSGRLDGIALAHREYLIGRYRLPQPRLGLGRALCGRATAAIDISDGLAADLGHIATASRVRISVEMDKVPVSDAVVEALADDPGHLKTVLTGGDDYEIAFTVGVDRVEALRKEWGITPIGRIEAGQGVAFLDRNGDSIPLARTGFTHF